MRTRPALTASDVQQMATACRAEADKNKWAVTVAIVDDAGALLYLERLEGAGPMTAEVATAKARTAALTRSSRPRSGRTWSRTGR
jgi:glc operon protein GlcG